MNRSELRFYGTRPHRACTGNEINASSPPAMHAPFGSYYRNSLIETLFALLRSIFCRLLQAVAEPQALLASIKGQRHAVRIDSHHRPALVADLKRSISL